MTIQLDSLSSEAQEDIAKVLGKEPAPEPEIEASADEEIEESESDEEVESDASNPDEETDEVDSEVEDSEEEEAQASEPDIEYIKANGKKVKIDFNDRDNIKRVYSLAAGARQWQAERDSLKEKNEAISKEYGDLKETINYLESIKDNHEELFEAVTGKSLQSKFDEWAEEQNMIGSMTEREKAMYLSNQDHQKKLRQVQEKEKNLQKRLEEVAKKDEEAKQAKQTSIANPIFFKYNFDGELGNDQLEHRMNKALWSEAREELSAFEEVTPDMVEETFNRISNQIRGGFNASAKKAVSKTVKDKRKQVKSKAQKMAVAEPKETRKQELDELIKAGDIAGALQYGDLLSKM